MVMEKAVQIVTIKNKFPLYKGQEKAERVEGVSFNELGYEIVSQKDLYEVGDRAVLILPDYSLSDIKLFKSFTEPGGDPKKSLLGRVGGEPRRVRAKKFNLSKTPDGDKVYSNGILLPYLEVINYLNSIKYKGFDLFSNLEDFDLQEVLGITKYEAPEESVGGPKVGKASSFPSGIYKTDETNIYNQIGRIEFPIVLTGTLKVDGSSISIMIKDGEPMVCSRNMRKPFFYEKVVGYRKKGLLDYLMFWKKFDGRIVEEVDNMDDDFVKYGRPYISVLESFKEDNIVLRGELCGAHLRGSGNKNNPHKSKEPGVLFFGIDRIIDGVAKRLPPNEFFKEADRLGIPTVDYIFCKRFNTFGEIIEECDKYFKENLVEGIVVRSEDGSFSAKCMNLEYDSKK